MYLPVTVPPLAALSLARDAARGAVAPATRPLLALTGLLGIAGVGFHIYGVSREMGGWRNWRQTLFDGPPIPAPPAFTGLAIAALGACSDIAYIPMRRGFLYLVAIMDWAARKVLAWRVSNTMDADFCVEALRRRWRAMDAPASSTPIRAADSPLTISPPCSATRE